jgi:flavin-dependent dehydrogenase
MASHTSGELKTHLHTFVEKQRIPTEGAQFYSHVLPSPQEHTLSQRSVLGKNWALIGDAAAWVDPLTGEGLFYAMRSGELLGRALAEGCPEKYPALSQRSWNSPRALSGVFIAAHSSALPSRRAWSNSCAEAACSAS